MATIAEHIKQAEEHVNEAGLRDESLRPVAFKEVLRHILAGDHSEGERVPFERSLVPIETNGANGTGHEWAATVATTLGLTSEMINIVFTMDQDNLRLGVHTTWLPDSKAAAVRDIAIVIAAANKALGRETRTPDVRAILEEYNKLDQNYLRNLNRIPRGLLTTKGSPKDREREIIIHKGGMEEAARIITGWAEA